MHPQKTSFCTNTLDLEEIADAALQIIRCVQREVFEDIRMHPENVFETATIGSRTKPLLAIDLVAERSAAPKLRRQLRRYGLWVVGEESLRDETLECCNEDWLAFQVDVIDGSGLLQRGASNWCSAIAFFHPPQQKIVAAFLGLPHVGIYMARYDLPKPWKYSRRGGPHPPSVSGPSRNANLSSRSIAFYGQKVSCFSSPTKRQKPSHLLGKLEMSDLKSKNSGARIYNLAGNSVMVRMIDGWEAAKTDTAFELKGQALHDMVCRAYIAQKAVPYSAIFRAASLTWTFWFDVQQAHYHPEFPTCSQRPPACYLNCGISSRAIGPVFPATSVKPQTDTCAHV